MGIKLLKALTSFAKESNSTLITKTQELKELKGDSIFSTLKKVWQYNNQDVVDTKLAKEQYGIYKKIKKGKMPNPKTIKKINDIKLGINPNYMNNILFTSAIGCYINKDDIQNAKKELGTAAMLEEIAKTSIMFNLFSPALKTSKKMVDCAIKTSSVYSNSAKLAKGLAFSATPATLTTGFTFGASIKGGMDCLWETSYEKEQNKK